MRPLLKDYIPTQNQNWNKGSFCAMEVELAFGVVGALHWLSSLQGLAWPSRDFASSAPDLASSFSALDHRSKALSLRHRNWDIAARLTSSTSVFVSSLYFGPPWSLVLSCAMLRLHRSGALRVNTSSFVRLCTIVIFSFASSGIEHRSKTLALRF